ncbi:MAG: hypothetical protein ACLFV6_07615 [Spirulinaceae cyanobacterium]
MLNVVYSEDEAEGLLAEDFYPKRAKMLRRGTPKLTVWMLDILWAIWQIFKVVLIEISVFFRGE